MNLYDPSTMRNANRNLTPREPRPGALDEDKSLRLSDRLVALLVFGVLAVIAAAMVWGVMMVLE